MTEVTIAGRKIPLLYNVRSWIKIEKEVCALALLNRVMRGRPDKEGAYTTDKLEKQIAVIRILGNEGLSKEKQQPDLTDEWLIDNIDSPALLVSIRIAACEEIDKAFATETEKSDPNEPRDLVLEDINRKKTSSD